MKIVNEMIKAFTNNTEGMKETYRLYELAKRTDILDEEVVSSIEEIITESQEFVIKVLPVAISVRPMLNEEDGKALDDCIKDFEEFFKEYFVPMCNEIAEMGKEESEPEPEAEAEYEYDVVYFSDKNSCVFVGKKLDGYSSSAKEAFEVWLTTVEAMSDNGLDYDVFICRKPKGAKDSEYELMEKEEVLKMCDEVFKK